MNRKTSLSRIKVEEFDLLIIGGGITGTGIALDASNRGLKTALIEMQDFASGTSSRSTKLIHGGLRYLKQFEFGLVNEVGRERAIVHNLAPHLVHPDKMLLPLIRGGNYGKWLTSLGLSVYDWLAGVNKSERKRMLDKEETAACEPLLRKDIVEGGGLYSEYRTDDARLVMSVAKTAAEQGAVLVNYTKAGELLFLNEKVCGVKAIDVVNGEEFFIRAKHTVNATGPWVDDVRAQDHRSKGHRLQLTKGVHLVIDKKKLPLKQTAYFDNADGRMIFAVPRDEVVYLGTTDTHFEGDKSNPEITKRDVEYILKACNNMFPSANLKFEDVQSSWAGLRPLVKEEGKSETEISRKDEIFVSPSGLISIAGGKLTGYRKMAERAVDKVCKLSNQKCGPCSTDKIRLTGGEFDSYESVNRLIAELIEQFNFAAPNDINYLVHNYGTEAKSILKAAIEMDEPPEIAIAIAEAEYTVDHEMVEHSLDYFERRTGRLNFRIGSIARIREKVLDTMAKRMNWSPERVGKEKTMLDLALKNVTTFK